MRVVSSCWVSKISLSQTHRRAAQEPRVCAGPMAEGTTSEDDMKGRKCPWCSAAGPGPRKQRRAFRPGRPHTEQAQSLKAAKTKVSNDVCEIDIEARGGLCAPFPVSASLRAASPGLTAASSPPRAPCSPRPRPAPPVRAPARCGAAGEAVPRPAAPVPPERASRLRG